MATVSACLKSNFLFRLLAKSRAFLTGPEIRVITEINRSEIQITEIYI